MTMLNFANHIIARAQNEGTGITNLQLQKVLYFSIIEGLRQDIIDREWLEHEYDNQFLVWRYGPVVENIYERYSIFGASKIFIPQEEDDNYQILNNIINNLLHINVFDLVNRSHRHSHWLESEGHIDYGRSDVPYDLEDLINAANEAN